MGTLEKWCNVESVREDLRKLGVNFITAGIVGVFINHFVGSKFSIMFLTSLWITAFGVICSFVGIFIFRGVRKL